ncbi:MAG: hypothetical protein R2849_09155 [Thermomicrobiales bacterium]
MSPALVLSVVSAIFLGCIFHVVAGRRIWQWPLFVGMALLGFFGGFLASVTWNIEWMRVGDVPMLISALGALASTSLASFFSAPRASAPPARQNS